MTMLEMFFHVPYRWTFECNQFFFQLYMWLTFAIPCTLAYVTYMGLVIADPSGKHTDTKDMRHDVVLAGTLFAVQFFTVLGIGNILYYT